MKVYLSKYFLKQDCKLKSIQAETEERLALFSVDPTNIILNNHALTGKLRGYRSINITGDYRAIYELVAPETAHFIDLDKHSNLYK